MIAKTIRLCAFFAYGAIVLIFNVFGTCAFAPTAGSGSPFEPNILQAFQDLGRETLKADFTTTFQRAVFAGLVDWLDGWLPPAAKSARPVIIIVLSYVIALVGFTHIIAGSFDCLFLVQSGQAS